MPLRLQPQPSIRADWPRQFVVDTEKNLS